MASDPPPFRQLVPQSAQMSSFTFAPQAFQQPRETQRNFVFVDEHNRHKRLKVMRACEGCRRRKIKCDAATTNTWPCSACVRLKLNCVRPNGFDGSSADTQVYEPPSRADYEGASQAQAQSGFRQQQEQSHPAHAKPQTALYSQPTATFADSPEAALYHPSPYSDGQAAQHGMHYTSLPTPGGLTDHGSGFAAQDVFPTPPLHHGSQASSPPDSYSQDSHGQDLADLLGPLRLNEAGTAPYLNSKMRTKALAEEPLTIGDDDEYKSDLPPLVSGPGLKIRIPPELMPDDETVLHYLDLYFSNVHPYVPVLDRATFYDQWHHNREALSPLLLEAIFAIAGRLADEPGEGQQWLALATRHADSFMDIPRLSTLQALLIVLKAREAAPKRGYYFRSWMSIVHCVQMGKDLGLDEHLADHEAGRPCGSSPAECLMKTRVWQTIFVCEVMIGSPQGRTDLAVHDDTVDLRVPRPTAGVDEAEYHVSRNFTYFARVVANVARMNRTYARVRKKNRDWGLEPEFVQLTPLLHAWLNDLPSDMAVNFPPDGSPPWLVSPFIGNMHSYYHLSVIMLHRPQLQCLDPNSPDGRWKHHMVICYSSAKLLCRLESAILQAHGLSGLQCMQRGINFTIYAILTCIILHLVALTSPDPELNSDARDYFTRHMRILEKCMASWPMPEMQRQIDAVREAFSADIRKPFVLKPSFPYGSPYSGSHASPPRSVGSIVQPGSAERRSPVDPRQQHNMDPRNVIQQQQQQQQLQQQQQQQLQQRRPQQQPHLQHLLQHHPSQVSVANHPISPPFSAGPGDVTGSSSPDAHATIALMAAAPGSQASAMQPQAIHMADTPAWNPSRLFDQWNTTFGTPQAQPQPISIATATRATSLSGLPTPGAPEVPTLQDIQAAQSSMPQAMQQAPAQAFSNAPVQTFVTPAMWQESVASVYEGGLKRAWDYDSTGMSLPKHRS